MLTRCGKGLEARERYKRAAGYISPGSSKADGLGHPKEQPRGRKSYKPGLGARYWQSARRDTEDGNVVRIPFTCSTSLTSCKIQIYEPAVLVVGTRGRNLGGMQGLLPGSVSKYCLQQSPIPVIVVRPSTKRLKKKKKRMADPARRNYNSILEKARGGYSLDKTARNSIIGPLPLATDQEAAAVAKAIGVPKNFEASPLPRVVSSKTDASERSTSPRPVTPASSNVVMKSPNLSPVDSPEVSDGDSDDASWTRSPKVRRRAGKARGATVDEVDPSRDPPWLAAILASDTRKV